MFDPANPYDLRNLNQCATIGAEITRLNEVLGPDTDEPPSPDGSFLSEQAADAAKAAGVDTLVLNHLVPPQPLDYGYAAFLGDARKHFDGPIIVGEDGMLFSLQRGDDSIRRRRLF